jgi:hypothetical protein
MAVAVAAITTHQTPDWHLSVPKPKPFSPLSLPARRASPCKCECSDTERTAFFTAVVSVSAVGGHDAAHARSRTQTRQPPPAASVQAGQLHVSMADAARAQTCSLSR